MKSNLDRRAPLNRRRGQQRVPRWLRLVLEVPLQIKLFGANLSILAVAGLILFGPIQPRPGRLADAYIVAAALVLGAVVNFVLVRLALGPIASLERVAGWISEGRLGERVPASISADHELARLSNTINEMLDSLAAARERMDTLGAEVIYAEERGRSQVVQALDDSVGQMLADASFEIAAAASETRSDARANRFAKARELLRAVTEEIRKLSSSTHLRAVTNRDLARELEMTSAASPPRFASKARSTVDIAHGLVPDRRAEGMALEIPAVGLRRVSGGQS